MNEIQKKLLEIAEEVKRVCEKHGIRYFLDYGSLLGAVRHKGFIPWDDDMDIAIPRPDYEKFAKVCKTELSERFALRTIEERNYIYYFNKVDDKTTTLIEDFNRKSDYRGGLYVDIFPLDGLPDGKAARKRFKKKCRRLSLRANLATLDFSAKKYPWYKRLIIALFRHADGRKCLLKLNKLIQKYDYESSEYVCSDIIHEMPVPKKLFEESAEYEFEGVNFASVKDYDGYLKALYGDYMTPPPQNEQVSNHYYNLDMNNSYTAIN